jgi:DNA-directed RNA polymerase subunit RPC12/RpoP
MSAAAANEDVIRCRWCNAFFDGPDRRANHAEHLRAEHSTGPADPRPAESYPCLQCNRATFPTPEDLDRHARVLHGPNVCPECAYRASNVQMVTQHRKRVHGLVVAPTSPPVVPKEEPVSRRICGECGRSFVNAHGLEVHRARMHKPGSPAGGGHLDEPTAPSTSDRTREERASATR